MAKPTGYVQAFVRLQSTTGEWLAHPDLRGLLAADAVEQETNLTDVATQILGRRYGVPVETNGRRTDPGSGEQILNMRIPQRLATSIKTSASRANRQWIDEIRASLCAHYGLRVPPAPRRIRRPRRAAS